MERRICTTDRAALRAWVPSGYDPRRHVGGMFAVGALAIAALLWAHRWAIAPSDAAVVALVAATGTLIEYVAHRWVMHRRRFWIGHAWDAHVGRHHHFYRSDALSWDAAPEIWLILFSPLDVTLLVAILALPAAALRLFVPPGAWAVGIATAIGYLLWYEGLHLACHLPARHAIARAPWLAGLRRRHQRHHQLSDMNANFGVTTALWDRVFGTARR